MNKNIKDVLSFYDLIWDTEFFGVRSAKAILYEVLSLEQWRKFEKWFQEYDFISIENRNSAPQNSRLIAKYTNAFLVDVNIQFIKELKIIENCPKDIMVMAALKKDEQILEIANFQYSRFTEDPELARRGGSQVYCHWLLNSFSKEDKIYALSKYNNGKINGFLLHSYSDKDCLIELIAVAKDSTSCGIGTKLIQTVENSAFRKGCKRINVGTQIRNTDAINFYHKMGFKQSGCHQIYHLWANL